MAPEQKVLMANAWEPNTEHREPSVREPTNYQNEENQRTTSEWVIHSSDSHQHSTLTNASPSCLGGWVYRTLLGNFSSTALYNVQQIGVH